MKNKNSLIVTCIVCMLPLIAGLILINRLPAQIPVQWGSDGEISNYAPKWFAVAGVPVFFLIMNLFLYTKAEKSELSIRYPQSMKLFLKWSMPMLAVIGTSLSYASALDSSMVMASAASVIGVLIILFGSYFYNLIHSVTVRTIFAVSDENAERVYTLCGNIFVLIGIAAALIALVGYHLLSLELSAAAFVVAFVYLKISKK